MDKHPAGTPVGGLNGAGVGRAPFEHLELVGDIFLSLGEF